jgi:hypothetical protein
MGMSRGELVRLIREAGRVPVERDTLYGVVEDLGAAEAPEASMRLKERNKRRLNVASP